VKQAGLFIGGIAAALAAASPVSAQVTPDTMVGSSQAKTVKLDFNVRADHDSNILKMQPGAPGTEGLRPEDTTYTPSVDLNLVAPVGRQALFLNGEVGYVFHQNNKRLDTSRIDLTGGLGLHAQRCGATVSADYFRGRSAFELPALNSVLSGVLLTDVRNILDVESVNAGVTCSTPVGLGVFLTGSESRASNSEPTIAVSDYRKSMVSGGLRYGRPSSGSVSLVTSFTHTETPKRIIPGPGDEGYDETTVGLSFDRRVGGRIQANAAVSYFALDLLTSGRAPVSPAATSDHSSGITYSGGVDYRASSRLQFNATFQRSVQPTILPGSPYQLLTGYTVGARYKIGTRIFTNVGADWNKIEAPAIVSPLFAPTLTNSRLKGIFGQVRYQLNKRLSVSVDARQEQRRANLPQFDYTSRQVGLVLAVSY